MCFACDAYGDGGLWYLNPKNFARQLYKVKKPGEKASDYGTDPETQGGARRAQQMEVRFTDPERFQQIVKEENIATRMGLRGIPQAIPLQDAFRVVEMAYPVAAMMCICRKTYRGTEETNIDEYSCTGLGPGMLKWERWPERYRGGVHFMSVDEAKEWLTKWNKKGMMHSIMTFGGSYVGGICNCDYPDCAAIRNRLDYGFEGSLLKSHYVAKVSYDKCNGCGVCVQRCQFGALKFEVTMDKANIDMFRCFGCGLCQTGCPRGAIDLIERMSIPALREVW